MADLDPNLNTTGIDLYWLPLGAGGHCVRWNGRAYEWLRARREHRSALPLYHSALIVNLPSAYYVVEMTPAWVGPTADRGVVAEGAVGARWAGHLRLFTYEVRCWLGGAIGDVDEALTGPRRLTRDPDVCRRLLAALPSVPTPVWGRDELHTGDMWNSNSVTAWALAESGLDMETIHPPTSGRAPGWAAGLAAQRRSDSVALNNGR
jgi:hypothetical protein